MSSPARGAASVPRPAPFDFGVVGVGPRPSEPSASVQAAPPRQAPINPSVSDLRERFPGAVLGNELCAGDQDVIYADPSRIAEILRWLHDDPDQQYDHLADVTAVDHGGGRPLQVVYQLWSIPSKRALRIKCELPLDALEIDSATAIWRGADWLEREVYDLFGVRFRGHPNLRRILMPDNYAEGHPLRKDFPLRGRFSRAEQTRRALTQDPEDHYAPGEIGRRAPQTMENSSGTAQDAGDPSD